MLPQPNPAPHWYPRFAAKVEVDPDTGCWVWIAARNHQGYGKFQYATKDTRVAHRVSYEAFHGPIPDGLVLDHFACNNRSCVNPDHVRPVTVRENVLRSDSIQALNLAKTHCVNGHPFSPENTAILKSGTRGCRACQRAAYKAWKKRRYAAGWKKMGDRWEPPPDEACRPALFL